MKRIKHVSAVTLLLLVLSIPAFAGDIEMPGYAPPPPPPPTSVLESGSNGATTGNINTFDLEEAAINLLISTISIF
jgi:hypothetical protein